MRISKIAYLYIAILAVLCGILLVNYTVFIRQLDNWQLLPRPERLSELYFTNERQLPSILKVGSSQKISFTVHNLEQQATTYHYKVVAATAINDTGHLLGEGQLTLNHGQFETTSQTVIVPSLGTRLAMKVVLEYERLALGQTSSHQQTQSIFFWAKVVGLVGMIQGETSHDS